MKQHPALALPDVPRREEVLSSYSGLHRAAVPVYYPETLDQLVALLGHARAHHLPITVHGGGLSLDEQGIGRGLVVSLRAFRAVIVDAAAGEVTAGAGARWAEVLETLPAGLVPRVVITSGEATVGGTLSSNSLSRFSPVFGREGDAVVALDVLLADGRVVHCRQDNEHARLLAAAGGFGFLGIVLRVRFRLLDVRHLVPGAAGRAVDTVSVETDAARHAGFASLGRDLLDVRPDEAVYSVASLDGRGVVLRSRYRPRAPRRPMPVHRPYSPLRAPFEWLMWLPGVNPLMWRIILQTYYRLRTRFIDDLRDYTFMMDGNLRALRLPRALGLPLRAIQQTFLLPAARDAPGDSALRLQAAVADLGGALRQHGVAPSLLDIFFAAQAPGALGGHFALTPAFVTLRARTTARVLGALEQMSEACLRHGGRVHLVKNVQARPACLAAMYAAEHRAFLALKQSVDPEALFRNDFFARVFCLPGVS